MESLEGEFDTALARRSFKNDHGRGASLCGARKKRRRAPRFICGAKRQRAQEAGEAEPSAVIEWRGLHLVEGLDPFHSFAGSDGLRMSLAAKIIAAHGGEASHAEGLLRVRLPIKSSDK